MRAAGPEWACGSFWRGARGIVTMAAIDWLYSKLIGGFTSHWLLATWSYGGTSVNWLGEHAVLAPNPLTKDAINLFMQDFGASWAGNRRGRLLRVSRSYGQSYTPLWIRPDRPIRVSAVEKQWSFENCTCNAVKRSRFISLISGDCR